MISVAVIVQQQRRVSIVGDENIYETIVIEIRECYTTRGMRGLRGNSSQCSYVDKFSMAFIVEQRIDLLVARSGRSLPPGASLWTKSANEPSSKYSIASQATSRP